MMATPHERRQQLYTLLGKLPDRHRRISAKSLATEQRDRYVLETLELDLNGIEPVPAYFARPLDIRGKVPAIVYNHAHGGDYALGKGELLRSRVQLQPRPYVDELTSRGYAVLCIDHWVFGQRATMKESELFKLMLWRGQVMWGMMLYDSIRAVDYLTQRDDVDADRIATLGLSMGSNMAWWLAALDERIKVCIDLCCLTDYDALIATAGLDRHGLYYYVPDLLNHFTTAQINALIAPRPHLSLAGARDSLTPPQGLDRIDRELRQVYAHHSAADRWRLVREDVGHEETATMRREVLAFLHQWL
jgi:dienelactone hydrolase